VPNMPPASRSAMASNSSGLNGLRTSASAPAFFAAPSVPPSEPVKSTIGISRVAGGSLQLDTELDPGRAGHIDVEHDHVRPGAANLPPGSSGIFGFDNGDVGDLERRLQQSAKSRIVVDQQNPQARCLPFPET